MAGHLRSGDTARYSHFYPVLEYASAVLQGKSGLLQMQNFPFIFKILYPNVAGRKLIYTEGAAKESTR